MLDGLWKKASLVGAFFVFGGVSAAWGDCPLRPEAPVAAVARVVDGDTLHLRDGRKVRLIGLNTPELGYRGAGPQPFAEAAQRALAARIEADGGRVRLLAGVEPRDRHGRLLAHAYALDGASHEAWLLRQGLGYFVAMAPNLAQVDCLVAVEQVAQQARQGLWRTSPQVPAAALRQAGFVVVATRVSRVLQNGGGLWLETPDDLVLRVVPEHLDAFDRAALESLIGRSVEARGWVVERRQPGRARWVLALGAPAMLRASP